MFSCCKLEKDQSEREPLLRGSREGSAPTIPSKLSALSQIMLAGSFSLVNAIQAFFRVARIPLDGSYTPAQIKQALEALSSDTKALASLYAISSGFLNWGVNFYFLWPNLKKAGLFFINSFKLFINLIAYQRTPFDTGNINRRDLLIQFFSLFLVAGSVVCYWNMGFSSGFNPAMNYGFALTNALACFTTRIDGCLVVAKKLTAEERVRSGIQSRLDSTSHKPNTEQSNEDYLNLVVSHPQISLGWRAFHIVRKIMGWLVASIALLLTAPLFAAELIMGLKNSIPWFGKTEHNAAQISLSYFFSFVSPFFYGRSAKLFIDLMLYEIPLAVKSAFTTHNIKSAVGFLVLLPIIMILGYLSGAGMAGFAAAVLPNLGYLGVIKQCLDYINYPFVIGLLASVVNINACLRVLMKLFFPYNATQAPQITTAYSAKQYTENLKPADLGQNFSGFFSKRGTSSSEDGYAVFSTRAFCCS